MAFKEDWSFLDKITMGAVGTESVIRQLNSAGHNVIELERYCTSNKIWATKIKRLRIPDLLCLRCGKRIESRAKSNLGIIMSDAVSNADRRWYVGLRESDLVAFIHCKRNAKNLWEASNTINLFGVGDMLATESQTILSAPKSVYEGAERDRSWASYTPSNTVTITAIVPESNGIRIRMVTDTGRNQSKLISGNHHLYVSVGEVCSGNAKIVSSIVPRTCDIDCTHDHYNFLEDLNSDQNETKYTAVKALGFLPGQLGAKNALYQISQDSVVDLRIRLEAFASLMRLGVDVWEEVYEFAFSQSSNEIKMEFVLILGELDSPNIIPILLRIADDEGNDPELRAAAIWSFPSRPESLVSIIKHCFSTYDVVGNHATAKIENSFSQELTEPILRAFGKDDKKNAICAHILSSSNNVDNSVVVKRYLSEKDTNIRNWLLFSMGLSDSHDYEGVIDEIDPASEVTKSNLVLLWQYLPSFLCREQIDVIEFIKNQK